MNIENKIIQLEERVTNSERAIKRIQRELTLSTKEVAERLGVSTNTVRKYISLGMLKRIPNTSRCTLEEVERFCQVRGVGDGY